MLKKIVLPEKIYIKEELPEDISIKYNEETYKEKVYELNKERIKNKNEKEKIEKLKLNYDNLNSKLKNDIFKFNQNYEKKIENFQKYQKEEKNKIEKT